MPGMYSKADRQTAGKHRPHEANQRPSTCKQHPAEFDWDRAIEGLQRIFADFDRRHRERRPRR